MTSLDSFGARSPLQVGGDTYQIYRIGTVQGHDRLPYCLKVLLENLLRTEDGVGTTKDSILAVAQWDSQAEPRSEIQFAPSRVVMQDVSGVACIVDLATLREAHAELGNDVTGVNPLVPVELVVDHSVAVDAFGSAAAFEHNMAVEYERNAERYEFLRWGRAAFDGFEVVPPGAGIVHQVNIEHLARVVMRRDADGALEAYPDTCVGTDSHTTMVNGLGVLGWGVGGIEAEAAMLGQPVSMLIPRVVGVLLSGGLPAGVTATDLVLTITEMLRCHGVVGQFVEFFGEGVATVPLADRATISNMSPEFGSTCAFFPIDDETLNYLRFTGRDKAQLALVETYSREQGLWHDPTHQADYSETLFLDLSTITPSIAGPKRPHDRIPLDAAKASFRASLPDYVPGEEDRAANPLPVVLDDGTEFGLGHGAVTIASITSCTNTSNPSLMIAAALLARNAVERGLERRPWVKTSLAPGSKVVMAYYERSGLLPYLEKLGFHLVGYGCTTCVGNSGPLPPAISRAIDDGDLAVTAVLSGNRNFEGRIHPEVKMNYLASPPLVVAYALAGTMDLDLTTEPLGYDSDGNPVALADVWPSPQDVRSTIESSLAPTQFISGYADVFAGDERWSSLPAPTGDTFSWDEGSTYLRKPPYLRGMDHDPPAVADIAGARVLVKLGDSVTTDHISPVGAIERDSPAGRYLTAHGVDRADFNSYGSRRGNHEVMVRGTFANTRLRNQLTDGGGERLPAGGWTADYTDGGRRLAVFDAAQNYAAAGTPLIVLAGNEYGAGSARDWAAKGTALLGVRAVIAKSYERIHRSNLVGMGVLPLQYQVGDDAESLGLTGTETFSISGLTALNDGVVPDTVRVTAASDAAPHLIEFDAHVRIDTVGEAKYYLNGGILRYVLRRMREGDVSLGDSP